MKYEKPQNIPSGYFQAEKTQVKTRDIGKLFLFFIGFIYVTENQSKRLNFRFLSNVELAHFFVPLLHLVN